MLVSLSRARLGALVVIVLGAFPASACRRSTPAPGQDAAASTTPAPTVPPGAVGGSGATGAVPTPGAPPAYGDPFNADAHALPPAEAPRDNLEIPTGTVVTPGESAAPAAPADPFAPVVQSVRASAVGCFAGLPPGEYSARIDVNVSPAGRATRVEVSGASTTDAAVLKCLEQAATREYPSSDDGRKLAIDVRVKG